MEQYIFGIYADYREGLSKGVAIFYVTLVNLQ